MLPLLSYKSIGRNAEMTTCLVGMQVITRTTGKQLGYVAQLYVDPQRLEVVSMDLKPDWLTIGNGADSSILLSALRQIGDVVLVHDESALEEGAAMGSTWGAVKLVGMSVETEDGQLLGKVSQCAFRAPFDACSFHAVELSPCHRPIAVSILWRVPSDCCWTDAGPRVHIQPR